jgi:hypothetical protein
MKHLTLTAVLVAGLATAARAQAPAADQPHRFEVGLEAVSYTPSVLQYSTFTNTRNNDKLHELSGVLFRYNIGRFGLRAGVSYNNSTEQTDVNNCNDCLVGKSKGQDLRLKAGAQYAPLTSTPWLYAFTDVYYRRYVSEGHFTGGFTGHQDVTVGVTSNGVGLNAGLGAKVKLASHFYLNPEVYYDVLRARNSEDYTDPTLRSYSQSNSRTNVHAPAARLNLIYAF